jgi:hypothetical protein
MGIRLLLLLLLLLCCCCCAVAAAAAVGVEKMVEICARPLRVFSNYMRCRIEGGT